MQVVAPTKYKEEGTSSAVTQVSLRLPRRGSPSCVVLRLCWDSPCQGKLWAAGGLPAGKQQPVLAEQGRPISLEKIFVT